MSSSSAIQTQIVNQSGHVLVITAPQCGAINVLINKARLLMDEAIAPQHILVLTCNEDSSFLQNKLSAHKATKPINVISLQKFAHDIYSKYHSHVDDDCKFNFFDSTDINNNCKQELKNSCHISDQAANILLPDTNVMADNTYAQAQKDAALIKTIRTIKKNVDDNTVDDNSVTEQEAAVVANYMIDCNLTILKKVADKYSIVMVYGLQYAKPCDAKLIVSFAEHIGASLIVYEPKATIIFQKEAVYKRVLERLDAKLFELTESPILDSNRINLLNNIENEPNANYCSSVKKWVDAPSIHFVDDEKKQFLNILNDLNLSEPTVIVAYHQEELNKINQQLQKIKINAMMGFDKSVETRLQLIIFDFLKAANSYTRLNTSYDGSCRLLFNTIIKLLPDDNCATTSVLQKYCVTNLDNPFSEADDLARAKEIFDAFVKMINVLKPEQGIHLLFETIIPLLKTESANISYYCDFVVNQLKPYDSWRMIDCKLLHPKWLNNPVHLSTSANFEHFDNKNVIIVNLIPGRISHSLAHYHTEYEQHITKKLFYNCVAHSTKNLTLIYRKDFYKPIEPNDHASLTRDEFYNSVKKQLNGRSRLDTTFEKGGC